MHAIKEETDQGSMALDSEEKVKAKKRKYKLSKQKKKEAKKGEDQDSASLHTSQFMSSSNKDDEHSDDKQE